MRLLESDRGKTALVLLLGTLAYLNSLSAPFQFDDVGNIVENPAIKSGSGVVSREELRSGELDSRSLYSPNRVVGFWTFALSYRLHGLEPLGYHVENLLLHLFNGLLVLLLVRLLVKAAEPPGGSGPHPGPWLAPGVAALFLVHPIQTQAVTYVVQRLSVVVALFYLVAVCCYLAARSGRGLPGWRRWLVYGAGLVATLAAMFSKESAATLPVMVALCELVFFRARLRERLAWVLPHAAVVAGAVWLRIAARPEGVGLVEGIGAASRMGGASRWEYLTTQLPVIGRYLGLLIAPWGQNVDHDVALAGSFWEPRVAGSFLLLAALAGAAVWMIVAARRGPFGGEAGYRRLAGFGVLWFFVALAVESSIFPIRDVIFEHRVYLPSVGFLLAVGAAAGLALGRLRRGPALARGFAAAACLVIVALAAATVARNRVWASEVSLWADAARKSPGKARPHNNLGTALGEAGDPAGAVEAFERALELDPEHFQARLGLGRAYLALGKTERGEEILTQAARGAPGSPRPFMELGRGYLAAGEPAPAEEAFRRAVQLDPRHMGARYNLGTTLLTRGRPGEAVGHLEEARRLDPSYQPVHRALGDAYAALGRGAEAIEAYRAAIERYPEDAEAHLALGTLLGPAGRLDEAEVHLLRAAELDPTSSKALNNLGNVHLQRGELAAAIERYEASLALDPDNGEAHYNLGLALRGQGREAEAAPHFRAAERLLGGSAR